MTLRMLLLAAFSVPKTAPLKLADTSSKCVSNMNNFYFFSRLYMSMSSSVNKLHLPEISQSLTAEKPSLYAEYQIMVS